MAAPESFDDYVAARYGALMRTAYLLAGNRCDAEDLVQTALMKAVPAWRRIESNPDGYLRRTMVNDSISRWRRRRGREVLTDQVPDHGLADPDPSRAIVLHDALARLAPRQRAVIVLRFFEDLTERETAEVLGIAVGTVKSQAREALARLRTLVPDLHVDGEELGERRVGTMEAWTRRR